jgi:phosphotransferase system HPr-like phosphotransfer protein
MRLLQTAATVGVTLIGLSLVGCGAQPGTTLVKLDRNEAATLSEDGKMTSVPRDGNVRLYGSSDLSADISYAVDEGDEVGFRAEGEDAQRRIIAVAGDNETTINQGTVFDRTFYWKFLDNE